MNSYDNSNPGTPGGDAGSMNHSVPQPPYEVPPTPGETHESRPNVPPYDQPPRGSTPYAGSPYANSPYANSPYMNPHQDAWGNPNYAPQPPKEKKPRSHSPWGRRVLAGVLVAALVAAGSGITALTLNSRWKHTMEQMQQENESQLSALQKQIEEASRVASSTAALPGGNLTPSQVYAKNVGSVVAISSTMGQNALGQVAQGSGSGFIVSQDGYIITNCHVIEGAVSISVLTGDNKEYPAKLLGKDPANDVAVLKIEAEGLPAVSIGSSNDMMIGDMVVAIGNPLGELTATQTVGYVCGKDRMVSTGGAAIYMLQTDAAINAGNSGGPLFNMKGEVIGITTAKYSGTTGGGASIEGIGFAIPIDDVLGILNDLAVKGYVTGPYLGVSVRDVDPQIASVYNIPLGANVIDVVAGASADRAGIQAKDIIVKLGEYPIKNSNDLIRALRHYDAGDSVSVTYSRGGAEHTVQMDLDEKPAQPTVPQEQPQQVPVPNEGDIEEWYDYFDKFFGDFFGVPRP